jgi:holo-[acyl-carrier protein] synthase
VPQVLWNGMQPVFTKNRQHSIVTENLDKLCLTSNIFQTGIDIVAIEDMTYMLVDPVGVIVTELEWEAIVDSFNPKERLAGKFAAKEAVMKAIGKGIDEINFTDIEVLNEMGGKPKVYLSGSALMYWNKGNFESLDISISHHGPFAIAIAVASKKSSNQGGRENGLRSSRISK